MRIGSFVALIHCFHLLCLNAFLQIRSKPHLGFEIPLVIVFPFAYSQNAAVKALETTCVCLIKQMRATLCTATRSQSQSSVKSLRRLPQRDQREVLELCKCGTTMLPSRNSSDTSPVLKYHRLNAFLNFFRLEEIYWRLSVNQPCKIPMDEGEKLFLMSTILGWACKLSFRFFFIVSRPQRRSWMSEICIRILNCFLRGSA